MNDEYFDPTFGGMDWRTIGDEYRHKLETVQDGKTFWLKVLIPMLFELGVSHLAALPLEFANKIDAITFASGSMGMDVQLLDGLAVITRVDQGSPADETGLRPGFAVTSVNGRAWEEIAAESLASPPYNEAHQHDSRIQGLRDLHDTSALIVDLRGTTGGLLFVRKGIASGNNLLTRMEPQSVSFVSGRETKSKW